jgi:hypothetical protein
VVHARGRGEMPPIEEERRHRHVCSDRGRGARARREIMPAAPCTRGGPAPATGGERRHGALHLLAHSSSSCARRPCPRCPPAPCPCAGATSFTRPAETACFLDGTRRERDAVGALLVDRPATAERGRVFSLDKFLSERTHRTGHPPIPRPLEFSPLTKGILL